MPRTHSPKLLSQASVLIWIFQNCIISGPPGRGSCDVVRVLVKVLLCYRTVMQMAGDGILGLSGWSRSGNGDSWVDDDGVLAWAARFHNNTAGSCMTAQFLCSLLSALCCRLRGRAVGCLLLLLLPLVEAHRCYCRDQSIEAQRQHIYRLAPCSTTSPYLYCLPWRFEGLQSVLLCVGVVVGVGVV